MVSKFFSETCPEADKFFERQTRFGAVNTHVWLFYVKNRKWMFDNDGGGGGGSDGGYQSLG